MVKKVVGVALATTLAIQLWSTIPPTSKRIVKKLHKLEASYRAWVDWASEEDK